MRRISILDTTLRDGEQTRGVSFSGPEKLHIAKELLEKAKVDRIEIASCKLAAAEQESVSAIMAWAKEKGLSDRVEVLSFVDGKDSLNWLEGSGCRRINLLCKGSEGHCRNQLGKSPEEHFADIGVTIREARGRGYYVGAYLEDWSRGMQENRDYVLGLIGVLKLQLVDRIYLCDTLGVLCPRQVTGFVGDCVQEFPGLNFEYHGHNDYGLATANAMAAVEAGATGIHVTVNGLGERAGNASLTEIVVALRDFGVADTVVDESALAALSRLCESYTQKILPDNAPVLGRNAFTHMSGVHVDGQEKAGLYQGKLSPQRFGREWEYGLGKLSGKKSLEAHLKSLDSADLSVEEQRLLLEKIHELNSRKKDIGRDDLNDLLKEIKK